MTVAIRAATPGDASEVLRLIRALADYEREPHAVKASEASIVAVLSDDPPSVRAFIAEVDGRAVGLALWFLNFSTWTGTHGLYLEDLFVDPEARGLGVGKALLRALAIEATALGCARMDWAVLDWNEPAMAFYRAIGARPTSGWQPWRIEGEALDRLAGS